MRLYVAYYFWIKKPEKCPDGVTQEEHDKAPPIIGPMIDSQEIPVEGAADHLIELQYAISQQIKAVRVCIISAIPLPIADVSPGVAVPKLIIPKGGRLQ